MSYYRAEPEGLAPLVDWMSHYGVFWRKRFANLRTLLEGDRSMNDPASKTGTQDIVVDEVFPHAPETIWKTLTSGALMARWIEMTPTGFEPVKGKRFTFQTTPARRVGWRHSLRGSGGDPERTAGLQLEERTRGKRRIRLAARHDCYLYARRRSRTERAFASSIPASCFRRTRPPSRTWAKAGRRSSEASAPSAASRALKEAELRRVED